jgi:hypothetical protein
VNEVPALVASVPLHSLVQAAFSVSRLPDKWASNSLAVRNEGTTVPSLLPKKVDLQELC